MELQYNDGLAKIDSFVRVLHSGQPSSGTGWYDARFFVGPTLGVRQVTPKGEGEGKQQQLYYGYSKHAPLIAGRNCTSELEYRVYYVCTCNTQVL